jgi:hypothetical protein
LTKAHLDIEARNDFQAYEEAINGIVSAFQYTLKVQREIRARLRDAFAPMVTFADGRQYPPLVTELPESVINTWAEITPQVDHPGAVSRLNDLLFARGGLGAGSHARSAIDGYLRLRATGWAALEITHGLLRALQLSQGLHDEERTERTIASVVDHYWENINNNAPPGITIPLIESIFDFDNLNSEVDHMISAARQRYQDPHIEDQLINWQIKRANDPARRQGYSRERVRIWLDAAVNAAPLLRLMYLETAARFVDDVNDSELKQNVRLLLQNAGKDDLGLKTSTSTLNFSQEEVERYIAQFIEPPDWQGALEMFSRHPPPTGDYEENTRLAREIDAAAPLQATISRVRVGGDGLPRWQPITEEDREDARLARIEEFQAILRGSLLAQVLHRIGEHYSRPDRQALVQYFSARPTIAPGTAEQLGTAVDLFWKGEEDAALHIAVWLIEPLLRNLLLQSNKGIYSVQRRRRPGQYPGLGFLLTQLRDLGFDVSWYRYLWTVFASPVGLNLRNELAHGFTSQLGANPAALAIHASCFLTTVQVTSADQAHQDDRR